MFKQFVSLCFFVIVSTSGFAKIGQSEIAAIEAAAKEAIVDQRIVGLSLAVLSDGELSYEGGVGYSDLENRVPAKAETSYRFASISKPLSAVLAMQLVEEGKLDLDKLVQDYCPEFPVKPWPIRVRHLLSHTSGIRHYKGDEALSTKAYKSMVDALTIFKEDALLFEPATSMQYTTYGYTLLGCVMEKASGQSYKDALKQRVLDPA